MYLFQFWFQHYTAHKTRKGNETYTDWEGRNETSLFTDDMTIFVENSKIINKKFLDLVSDDIKFSRYKVNV